MSTNSWFSIAWTQVWNLQTITHHKATAHVPSIDARTLTAPHYEPTQFTCISALPGSLEIATDENVYFFQLKPRPPTRARCCCSLIPRPNTGFGMRLAQAPLIARPSRLHYLPRPWPSCLITECLSWKFSCLVQCCKQWLIQQYIYNTSHISINSAYSSPTYYYIYLYKSIYTIYTYYETTYMYTLVYPLVYATEWIRCAHTVTRFLYLLSPWVGAIGQLVTAQESV